MGERNLLRVEMQFTVKTYDIDFAGIASNIVYIRWLEDLRLKMLEAFFPLEQALQAGLAPALLRTTIEYRRPLRLLDRPVGRMWISDLRQVRGVLQAEFALAGEVTTTAEQVYCFVDVKTLRPAPQPEEIRRRFREAREDTEEAR
jgi:acyl-CoA thioester hydrolase